MSFLPVRYSLVMLAWLCAASHALGCSRILPEYRSFDAREYVFYGEVIGYTRSGGIDCVEAPGMFCGTWGWKLAVLEPVSMPQPGLKQVEVYKFGSDSLCRKLGYPRSVIEETPIGRRLMIVANAWSSRSSSVPQLDASDDIGAIMVEMPLDADPVRLHREEFDYRVGWGKRASFELRKDMLRLEQDTAPEARKRILSRLSWVIGYGSSSVEPDDLYLSTIRRYVSDEAAVMWLMAQRRETAYQIGFMAGANEAIYEIERAREGSAEYQFYYGIREWHAYPAKAIPWFKRASRAGFVAADVMLGQVYKRLSTEVAKSERAKYEQLARASFRRAAVHASKLAQSGDVHAQLLLATHQDMFQPWVTRSTKEERNAIQCALQTKVSKRYWQVLEANCERPQ